MAGRIIYIITFLALICILAGCYCGAVYTGDNSGSETTLSESEGIFKVSVITESGVSPNTAEISFTDVISGEASQQWQLNEGETGQVTIDVE